MTDYAYTTVPGKIKDVLSKIRSTGRPPKLTSAHLKTLGFKSSNDATLIGVLRFINFIDASNIPTTVWNDYRGSHYKSVLAEAIKKGYADLFALYPDANERTNADLSHVFSTSSPAGAQVINKTIATFKALVDEADFTKTNYSTEATLQAGPLHSPAASASGKPTITGVKNLSPEVHIDIQIHISPESSHEQIEKIFEGMAKHLYGAKTDA